MTSSVNPAEIEAAVLAARWEVLQTDGKQLHQQMAAAVAARDAQALEGLNVRVQAHRARLHDFEVSVAEYRERFGREWKLESGR